VRAGASENAPLWWASHSMAADQPLDGRDAVALEGLCVGGCILHTTTTDILAGTVREACPWGHPWKHGTPTPETQVDIEWRTVSVRVLAAKDGAF